MLRLNKKQIIYCWCCDDSSNTGEGNLSKIFIRDLCKKKIAKIFTTKNFNLNKNLNKIIGYKYISPFIGIIFCWIFFLKKQRPVYVNYLPLWNIFLFILLPPGTIFGPITGGANYQNLKGNFIRKYVFPKMYKISEFFLKLRNVKIVFSTELLKPYLSKTTKKRSSFNYVFNLISKKKKKQKNIDFLIYNWAHKNKKDFFNLKEIKNLINLKFKVHIFGEKMKYKSAINHGYIKNKKIQNLLERTKFSFTSDENIYSLFTIECINNNVRLITDKTNKNKIKYFKRNFIFMDLSKPISKKKLRNH